MLRNIFGVRFVFYFPFINSYSLCSVNIQKETALKNQRAVWVFFLSYIQQNKEEEWERIGGEESISNRVTDAIHTWRVGIESFGIASSTPAVSSSSSFLSLRASRRVWKKDRSCSIS
jgi:hypothetical protein